MDRSTPSLGVFDEWGRCGALRVERQQVLSCGNCGLDARPHSLPPELSFGHENRPGRSARRPACSAGYGCYLSCRIVARPQSGQESQRRPARYRCDHSHSTCGLGFVADHLRNRSSDGMNGMVGVSTHCRRSGVTRAGQAEPRLSRTRLPIASQASETGLVEGKPHLARYEAVQQDHVGAPAWRSPEEFTGVCTARAFRAALARLPRGRSAAHGSHGGSHAHRALVQASMKSDSSESTLAQASGLLLASQRRRIDCRQGRRERRSHRLVWPCVRSGSRRAREAARPLPQRRRCRSRDAPC